MISENDSSFKSNYVFPHERKSSIQTLINSMDEQPIIVDQNNPQSQTYFSMMFSSEKFNLFRDSITLITNPLHLPLQTTSKNQQPIVLFQNENNLKESIFKKKKELPVKPNGKMNEHTESISQLYRKVLLTANTQQELKIRTFENKNRLQFKMENQKNGNSIFSENNVSLGFTQQLPSMITAKRKINKIPYKILDAPTLQDDYYLNLIDWSVKNVLSVGLSSCVYLWNSQNSKVTKLCEQDPAESITSVSWSRDGSHLAVGSTNGIVQVWDPVKVVKIRSYSGHHARVGSIAWNSNFFSTGSRDKNILNRDPRMPNQYFSKWASHKQQVCGLKWSFDSQQLCSGGNDNRLLIWSTSSLSPICKFEDHKAAVKAMAWSPHHHGLLVSGGGTADRTIRFRDTLTGTTLKTVEVGSQVCNLMFSKSMNQLVSTHGYSHNEINIWKCPKMQKISTLTGHTMRVLYLSMSPDGSTIVTGAGDETLRFWSVFPSVNDRKPQFQSSVEYGTISLR